MQYLVTIKVIEMLLILILRSRIVDTKIFLFTVTRNLSVHYFLFLRIFTDKKHGRKRHRNDSVLNQSFIYSFQRLHLILRTSDKYAREGRNDTIKSKMKRQKLQISSSLLYVRSPRTDIDTISILHYTVQHFDVSLVAGRQRAP